MKKEIKKQVELLKKYGVTNYTIENDKITINGSLDLRSLTAIPDSEFLKNTTINGWLDLSSLTAIPDSEFLKNTTINGWLHLGSLTAIPDSEFLKNTTINGWLYLDSLTSADRKVCKENVKTLELGYNKKLKNCYFDGILSKVLSVHTRKDITIYRTPFGFIAQKDNFTAHGKTIKKAIEDLQFKVIAEKLKNDPITEDTMISMAYYRVVTGSCEQGISSWVNANNLSELTEIKAKDLLPILEKTNAYGLDKFKSLITFK